MTYTSPETRRSGEDPKRNIESYTSLSHRTSMAEKLAEKTKTNYILLCDDAAFGVPEPQRPFLSHLPGYERAIMPGLLLSLGFENGGATLVLAPPNPVEMEQFKRIYESLDNPPPFSIFWENPETGKLIDLLTIPDSEYFDLCIEYARGDKRPKEVLPTSHLDIITRHAKDLFRHPTFVFPFQTTQEHYDRLSNTEKNINVSVILPDIPTLDKAWNNFLLRKNGLGEFVPFLIAITPKGEIIADWDKLRQFRQLTPEPLKATEENIARWVDGVLEGLNRFKDEGKDAYVKLDSNGVSGLGNLPPHHYPWLYDNNTPEEEKKKKLTEIIRKLYPSNQNLPYFTVIEELITPKNESGVKADYIVVGMVIDGELYPTGIFPFAVDEHDEYIGEWAVRDPEKINEDPQVWEELLSLYEKVGKVLVRAGYRNGIIAFDAFVTPEGKPIIHDYNFRRGGRSFSEAMLPFLNLLDFGDGYLNFEVKLPLPSGLTNEQFFKVYTEVCKRLDEQGAIVFSTAFGYFGPDHLKLKVLYPLSKLAGERSDHATQVHKFVENALAEILS